MQYRVRRSEDNSRSGHNKSSGELAVAGMHQSASSDGLHSTPQQHHSKSGTVPLPPTAMTNFPEGQHRHDGNFLHGTDVSASLSNLTQHHLEQLSDQNASARQLIVPNDKQLLRMAANLEGKTPEHNLLIVGGGEIDGGRDSASSRSGLSSAFEVQDAAAHSQVDRQRSEAAIFETPRSRA